MDKAAYIAHKAGLIQLDDVAVNKAIADLDACKGNYQGAMFDAGFGVEMHLTVFNISASVSSILYSLMDLLMDLFMDLIMDRLGILRGFLESLVLDIPYKS